MILFKIKSIWLSNHNGNVPLSYPKKIDIFHVSFEHHLF